VSLEVETASAKIIAMMPHDGAKVVRDALTKELSGLHLP
jgi:hypothetical protein